MDKQLGSNKRRKRNQESRMDFNVLEKSATAHATGSRVYGGEQEKRKPRNPDEEDEPTR